MCPSSEGEDVPFPQDAKMHKHVIILEVTGLLLGRGGWTLTGNDIDKTGLQEIKDSL